MARGVIAVSIDADIDSRRPRRAEFCPVDFGALLRLEPDLSAEARRAKADGGIEPNGVVAPIHPKAMPVILTTEQDIETWLTAPAEEALKLQRPVDELKIVARGTKEDKV